MKEAELQQHLHDLEDRLLHPDREPVRTALGALLAEDFKEFCTTGRIFNRQQLIDAFLASSPRPATMNHFYVTPLAKDAALATYHVTTPSSTSHHSSLWVLREDRWQLLFHQGTIAA
ncbi:MAG: hypothetical protein JWQ42_3719 [Edaphobacter sp.]|jgi:hypothetical protein|nr:hypothetical protein [Edaphobacter sp.]